MIRLAHLVKPVVVPAKSDLRIAQPVTFQSMRVAKHFAAGRVDVELVATHFPQDHSMVPQDFTRTRDLDRSVLDFGKFSKANPLPLLADMLDRLYEISTADYFIYSNVDIAVMPNFYVTVATLIEAGRDAMTINRRTTSTDYTRPDELPMMYAQIGKPHPGRDCFVFRRDVYPNYKLGTACIGTGGGGKVMLLNMIVHAKQFEELADAHLTFHLGDSRAWKDKGKDDYREHNIRELAKVVEHYRSENALPEHPLLTFIERKKL